MKKGELLRKDILYPELSYLIVGVLFEVHNELGSGYQERYYQKAIENIFKKLGISFKEQAQISMEINGEKFTKCFLDFVIEDKIILEIKRGERFLKSNIDQIYSYLKATGLKLGILANFTKRGLQFKRIINLHS